MNTSYNPFTLEGKTILVTGASSGIGRETAVECSKMGARIVITGRNAERLADTYSQLDGEGHLQVVADLNEESDIVKLVESCPTLDGLVNNAGRVTYKPASFVNLQDLVGLFQTNMFGPALLTKFLLKKRIIRDGGSLVFTSSIGLRVPTVGNAVYASTKAALSAWMRSCALECAPKGIRANAVLPGMVETSFINMDFFSEDPKKADLQLYPMGRYGSPKDIAFAIIYLLSDASSWVTGTEIIVDGGRCLK